MADLQGRIKLLRVAALLFLASAISARAKVSGELKQWHRVAIDIEGPQASESGTPNPFLDYRMQVEFTSPDGRKFSVPGFFAADGDAGESSAAAGKAWRAYFSPDQTGKWSYKVSLRTGSKLAVSDVADGGAPAAGDGEAGEFTIAASDKLGRDFRAKGRLQYIGGHHLRFAGSKEYFLKCGADSPENLLGYADFDGTSKTGGALKTWAPHVRDWKAGDPTWKGDKGKGLIGALNYLAAQGMNAFSFLTLNTIGDGKDVWMFTSATAHDRYDCSKLDQWEILFSHADRLGLFLHFKTQETEVDQVLDNGDLGDMRKLYYRELMARFGHHLALNWNLGEENTQTIPQIKDCINYFHAHDPYRHPIVIHTFPNDHDKIYGALKGDASLLMGTSIQTAWDNVYAATRKWREASAAAGRKWVIANDEQGGANSGVAADAGYSGDKGTVADNRDGIRQQTLWGNIMAGGAGVEYYFGYQTGQGDLTAQDYRSRQTKWDDARVALEFFAKNAVPYWEMSPASASSAGWTLAKPGEEYLVYLPSGGSPTLDLAGATGKFTAQWLNPRTGELVRKASLEGGSKAALGAAPGAGDWAVWVRKDGITSTVPNAARRQAISPAAPRIHPDGRASRGGSAATLIDSRALSPL